MKIKSSRVAFLLLLVSLSALAVPNGPLPEAWAPFARTDRARRPVEALSFDYRTGSPWSPSKVTYPWGEFVSGDKSVLVCGTDRRVPGMGEGGTGFGHLVLYAGKNQRLKPGDDFLGEVRLRLKADGPWNEPHKGDRFAADAKGGVFTWTRPWKAGGTNGVFTYTVRSVAPGKVEAEWDIGADAATWRARKLDRLFDMYLSLPKDRPAALRVDKTHWELNPSDPARHVSVMVTESGVRGRVAIDLHESTTLVREPLPKTGGFDFWGIDAYDVPPRPGRNLMPNGGFEQGLKGWRFSRGAPGAAITNHPGEKFTYLSPAARTGRHALCMDMHGEKGDSVSYLSPALALVPGKVYTASLWMRADRRHAGGVALNATPEGKMTQQTYPAGVTNEYCRGVTTNWTRHAISFVANAQGNRINVWTWGVGPIYIDDVAVEEGLAATVTEGDPVEANLVTADPYNYLYAGTRPDAALELFGRANLRGRVTATVSDYYRETCWSRTLDFALDAKGFGKIALEGLADANLGTGVFILKLDYDAAGLAWRDYARFTVISPLHGEPVTGFFAHFPWFAGGGAYLFSMSGEFTDEMGKRMMDWGVGATSWQSNGAYAKGYWAPYYRKFGIVNKHHLLQSDLSARHPDRFGYRKPGLGAFTNAAPEQLAFIEAEAYRSAKEADPTDIYWTYSNEEELWQPLVRARQFDTYFKYQYACYKGLKRGFDERGMKFYFAPTHGTAAYCHPSSYAVMDGYLEAAAKQGFKYTCISVHTYHAVDGSILGQGDRDAGAEHLLERLRHYGYSDDVPILFPEGFNVLPYYIPDWGAKDWADCYQGCIPAQSLGNREQLHAGALARIYLTDLKRYPRLKVNHTWQQKPILDMAFTPFMFPMVMNTIGRLLPDPRFVGDARPWPDVRAYCFRPSPGSKVAVLAVWTSANDVENGIRKGDVLTMALPADAAFVDLMGNPRVPSSDQEQPRGFWAKLTGAKRTVKVPLMTAPLFILSRDAEGLLEAVRTATGGTAHERVKAKAREIDLPSCRGTPDWSKVAPLPMTNAVRGLVSATARLAWSGAKLFVRVEVEGAAAPALDVGIDGLCDARDVSLAELGPDDCAYRFADGQAVRTRETNTQFRDGGAGGKIVTDEEVASSLARTWKPHAGGGVWEIVLTPRFISPVRFECGYRFGLNLAVTAQEGAAALSASATAPATWPAFTFK